MLLVLWIAGGWLAVNGAVVGLLVTLAELGRRRERTALRTATAERPGRSAALGA
jgi:hypothetical protein